MPQLFISYSRADEDFARQIAQSLLELGADVWLDQEDIRSGEDWSDAIQRGLESSQIMLLILSPASMDSSNVADEWKYFHSEKKPIIPLLFLPTRVHFQLQRLNYVDFHKYLYDKALRQLHHELTLKGVSLKPLPALDGIVSKPLPQPALEAKPTPSSSSPEMQLSSKWDRDKGFQMESKMAFNPRTASAGGRNWLGEGMRVGLALIVSLVILVVGYVVLTGGEDDPCAGDDCLVPTETSTSSASTTNFMPTSTNRSSVTATDLLTNTPHPIATNTDSPTNTPHPSATNTDLPTNTPRPSVTSTDMPSISQIPADVLALAQNGVAQNADWTPYEQEFDGIPMMLVPAGCFMMGSEEGDDDEKQISEQCFDNPFWIDRTEVTNGRFGSTGCPTWSSKSNQPRNCISWTDAQIHCQEYGGRLPTEAEWEYASRGPSNLKYPWGNSFYSINAIYPANSNRQTAVVGSRLVGQSWVGLLDMSGNVWEWVLSWYDEYPYIANDGRESLESINNYKWRSMRGGSWAFDQAGLRSAYRLWNAPDLEGYDVGFRCYRPFTPASSE